MYIEIPPQFVELLQRYATEHDVSTDEAAESAMPSIRARIDKLTESDGNVRAYASINVAGAVAIHGLRVMDSSKGLFVSMPSRSYKDQNGKTQYSDIAHAVTRDVHNAISTKVLDAYEQALQESESETDGFSLCSGSSSSCSRSSSIAAFSLSRTLCSRSSSRSIRPSRNCFCVM